MPTFSNGKYGQIEAGPSQITHATSWTMDIVTDAEQFATFGAAGYKYGSVGTRSATGTLEGPYDYDEPIEDMLLVGRNVELTLYLRTALGGGEKKLVVPAQITGITYNVDSDSASRVGWTATWQSNGPWNDPS